MLDLVDSTIVYNDAAKAIFHFFGGMADATAAALSLWVWAGYRRWSASWRSAFGDPLWRSVVVGLREELTGRGRQDKERAALLSMFPALLACGLFLIYPLSSLALWGFGGAETLFHKWEATNAQFFAMQMTAAALLGEGFEVGTGAGLAFRIAFWTAAVHLPHAFVWRLWSKAQNPSEALSRIAPKLAEDLAGVAKDAKAKAEAEDEEAAIAAAIDDELSKARGEETASMPMSFGKGFEVERDASGGQPPPKARPKDNRL